MARAIAGSRSSIDWLTFANLLTWPKKCPSPSLHCHRASVSCSVLSAAATPASVAQLVEHLICNLEVMGSSPIASSRPIQSCPLSCLAGAEERGGEACTANARANTKAANWVRL